MALDTNKLLNEMTDAAKNSLGRNWPGIKDLAVTSFQNIAQNIVAVEQMKINGTITQEKAAFLISMQKNAAQMIIATEVGLGLLAAEAAINAALDVIRVSVNKAIGWNIV